MTHPSRAHKAERAGPRAAREPQAARNAHEQESRSEQVELALGTVGQQADLLRGSQLLPAQQQALAASIGTLQGNQHLQRLMEAPRPSSSASAHAAYTEGATAIAAQAPMQTAVQLGPFGAASEALGGALYSWDPLNLRTYTVASVLEEGDPTKVQRLSPAQVASASEADRLALVRLALAQGWVGPDDEAIIEAIWSSFGARLPAILSEGTNIQAWNASYEAGAEIWDMAAVVTLRSAFERDVKAQAHSYLDRNEAHVNNELESVGLPTAADVAPPTMNVPVRRPGVEETAGGGMAEDQTAQVQHLQAMAARVARAQRARNELMDLQVGWDLDPQAMPGVLSFGVTPEQHARDLIARGDNRYVYPVTFNPSGPPRFGALGHESAPLAPYQETLGHYNALTERISEIASRYPTIYGLIRENRIEEFALASPQEARGVMGDVLRVVLSNIRETRPKIDSDDLDYRELKPIHQQLFGGAAAVSGTAWNQPLARWVGQQIVKDHEDAQFWISLGLGTLAAAAFLVAELASFGSATFFVATGLGLGVSGLQAGMSWERYQDLATAADSSVSDELSLVSQDQASGALLGAVLDTAFFFLDAYAPLARGLRGAAVVREAAEAGARRAALEGLERLGTLGAEEARQMISRSIVELGVEETTRRSGKTAQELLAMVGEDSVAGARLRAFITAAEAGLTGAAELSAKLPNLAGEIAGNRLTRAQADQLVGQAIEQLGPRRTLELAGGWKKLSSTLGEDAASGSALVAWRDSLMADLEEYVGRELRGNLPADMPLVQRTGTQAFTSDLDISLLGPAAAANRERALSYLAGRAGTTPDALSRLLYTDLFTDPRRMHLYDVFEPAVRETMAREAATFEQQLIMNRRLHEALSEGNEALATSVRQQMSELGIQETRYIPLGPEDISRLNREIDGLHQQLEAAASAGDLARQQELAAEIGRRQAMINATEGGGYFSGGGVRRSVSEREGFPGYTPAELADEARRMLPSQIYTHVLDQLPKLDEQAARLLIAGNANEIANALKGIGKYGERLTEVVGEALGGSIPARARFDQMADTFAELITAARRGGEDPTSLLARLGNDSDAVVRQARQALDELEGSSSYILTMLRNRAGIAEDAAGSMARIQFLVLANTKFMRARDAVYWQLVSAARALRLGSLSPEGSEGGESRAEPAE